MNRGLSAALPHPGARGSLGGPAGLKRYLARQLYRTLERLHTGPNTYPQVA